MNSLSHIFWKLRKSAPWNQISGNRRGRSSWCGPGGQCCTIARSQRLRRVSVLAYASFFVVATKRPRYSCKWNTLKYMKSGHLVHYEYGPQQHLKAKQPNLPVTAPSSYSKKSGGALMPVMQDKAFDHFVMIRSLRIPLFAEQNLAMRAWDSRRLGRDY